MLPDAESPEEHNAILKSWCDKGLQSYGHFCAQMLSKTWKRIENERIFTLQTFLKKVNHLTRFDD